MQNDALNVSVNQQERTVTQVVIESKRSYDEVIQTFEANTHHITTDQFFQLVKNATTFALSRLDKVKSGSKPTHVTFKRL